MLHCWHVTGGQSQREQSRRQLPHTSYMTVFDVEDTLLQLAYLSSPSLVGLINLYNSSNWFRLSSVRTWSNRQNIHILYCTLLTPNAGGHLHQMYIQDRLTTAPLFPAKKSARTPSDPMLSSRPCNCNISLIRHTSCDCRSNRSFFNWRLLCFSAWSNNNSNHCSPSSLQTWESLSMKMSEIWQETSVLMEINCFWRSRANSRFCTTPSYFVMASYKDNNVTASEAIR